MKMGMNKVPVCNRNGYGIELFCFFSISNSAHNRIEIFDSIWIRYPTLLKGCWHYLKWRFVGGVQKYNTPSTGVTTVHPAGSLIFFAHICPRFLFCVFDLHSEFCCVGVRVKIYLIHQRTPAQPYYRFSPFSEKSGFEPSCGTVVDVCWLTNRKSGPLWPLVD